MGKKLFNISVEIHLSGYISGYVVCCQ